MLETGEEDDPGTDDCDSDCDKIGGEANGVVPEDCGVAADCVDTGDDTGGVPLAIAALRGCISCCFF